MADPAALPAGPPVVPRATCRLQFNADFGFEQARAIVPYLAALGISHIYASPLTRARPGSSHGYDVIDFNQLNPELGDEAAFERLVETLHAHDMGLLLDFVPNHMGVGSDNPWWLDVLEWGQESPYAGFFDIDWDATARGIRDKVVLPVLGDQYGKILEAGELKLGIDEANGSLFVGYYENRFPIAPRDYPLVLNAASDRLGSAGGRLADLAWRLSQLETGGSARARRLSRRQDAAEGKADLAALLAEDGDSRAALEAALAALNGAPGEPQTFRPLHRLLEDQAYRLAYWRVASSEINYRRFFDINELAGLRMERSEVFEATHRLLLRLIAERKVQGVRLDHIDGLYDPVGYCRQLLERAAEALRANGADFAPGVDARLGSPIYLLVEKILARHEHLREDLPVAGTTGYEFMNLVGGLFVDPDAERHLTRTYERFIGREPSFEAVVRTAKRQILRYALNSELHVLAHELHRLAQQSWLTRDFTLTGVREALSDVIVGFPVYRTYITAAGARAEDRRDLDWAIADARRESAIVDHSIFDFLYAALSTDLVATRRYRRADVIATAMHFQQVTGPVMAKSLEDTSFYRYHRLVALNEVGGEPDRFGISPAAFHTVEQREQRFHPLTMVTTSTHDHKRGEDVRVRIAALSEVPVEWRRRVQRWSLLNRFKRQEVEGQRAPSRGHEYLLYQILLGAWPLEIRDPSDLTASDLAERMVGYMTKAMREGKEQTSWTAQNPDYEAAVEQFVRQILDPERSRAFLADFLPFQERLALAGAVNGLAQVLLKLTAPGIPDLYQGTELWDLSLVDPDNRRPVDFDRRAAMLQRLEQATPDPPALLGGWRDGALKQLVMARALALRNRAPELFTLGSYTPLSTEGAHAERVVAFVRQQGEEVALVVAPRLVLPLLEGADHPLPPPGRWQDTRVILPEDWRTPLVDLLTDRAVAVEGGALMFEHLLADLPLALLARAA